MASNLKKIALFGPHDRFNYGDFLFPSMLKYALSVCSDKEFDFEYYSIVDADYTSVGAFPTKSYRRLKTDINADRISTVVITGGESLNATWSKIYSFINPLYASWIKNDFIRRLDGKFNLTKRFLGASSEHPFAVSKSDFAVPVKTVYNSVGGYKTVTVLPFVLEADYFAVRDKKSFESWEKEPINAYLIPDSAVILSDVYPKDSIEVDYRNFIRMEVAELAEKKYLFFQISDSEFKNENGLVSAAQQLDQLNKNFDCSIVLCPVGMAPGHEDDKALQKVAAFMKTDYHIIANPSIFEIMLLLSKSSLYVGTSLHGVITSMSYGVPYVAIGRNQNKLKNYLDTWAEEAYAKLYSTKDFIAQASNILSEAHSYDATNLNRQKKLYYEAVKIISDSL